MRVHDSSATRIFLKKKYDDATSGPEYNHQVLASSLISFTWKKNIEILVQKPSLNGLSIRGDQIFLRKRWPKKKKNGFWILLWVTCQSQKKMVGSPLVRRNKHV